MQILFIIAGIISIGIGMLGSMAEGDAKTNVEWTCYPPTQSTPQRCTGSSNAGGDHVPGQFILAGIGLEIAAAAVAIGGRRDAAMPPVPFAAPAQPMYPPRPMAPVTPAPAPQPGWPSA
ncbi:hypothetical protein AB0K00_25530 [Dactylosporangium sp. NPDC049525]|uniref:hypothetical protein n=1 Tax=Dactylosporangium sp. NPDC049525 TaxID=3154730 RepID=UPI00343C28A2